MAGSGGWIYRVEVQTGAMVWESRIGKITDVVDAWEKVGSAVGGKGVLIGMFNTCVAVADGVVACCDYADYKGHGNGEGARHGLVGFDAGTGKKLWALPDCAQNLASPLTWRHGGKEYIVSVGVVRAVAVEPKKLGSVMESITGARD